MNPAGAADFPARVASFVCENALIGDSARVAVAVSGGPDSVALLLALLRAHERGLLPQPVGVLHFHHGIRGEDADSEAAFCAGLAARFGLPCVVGLGAVPKKGAAYSNDAARRARYAFLEDAARDLGADVVATAHTKNDQAETVLWRVLRGTGLSGLSGIPPRRHIAPDLVVVRPLLGENRDAVEAFCQSEGVTPRRDPTNANRQFTRVRVRSLIPDLARDFNPRLFDALPRLAAHAARDADLLRALADALWNDAIDETPAGTGDRSVRLRVSPLVSAHAALRFRVLLRALRRAYQNAPHAEEASTDAFVQVLDDLLHAKNNGAAVDLPGKMRAYCDGETLFIAPAGPKINSLSSADSLYQVALPVPGTVDLSDILALRITARWRGESEPAAPRVRRARAVDCACPVKDKVSGTMERSGNAALPAPLWVRNARAGDRFAPLGMNGKTRLVRDVLADAKVPTADRETFPLVVRGDTGAILWVVGVAQAEETRISDTNPTGILHLLAEPAELVRPF